jgi:hypothetical protein
LKAAFDSCRQSSERIAVNGSLDPIILEKIYKLKRKEQAKEIKERLCKNEKLNSQ